MEIWRACILPMLTAWLFVSVTNMASGLDDTTELRQLVFTSGPSVAAQFQGISPSGDLVFEVDSAERTVKPERLFRWGRVFENLAQPHVILSDGSLLAGSAEINAGEGVAEIHAGIGHTRFSREHIRALMPNPSHTAGRRDRRASWLSAPGNEKESTEDRMLLFDGDEITGKLVSMKDGQIRWQSAFGEILVEEAEIEAVSLSSPEVTSPAFGDEAKWLIGIDGGSRVFAQLAAGDSQHVRLILLDGQELELPVSRIVFLQAFGNSITYVSDLEPLDFEHVPFFQLPWSLAEDGSVDNAALRAAGDRYIKGLGMHSSSRAVYRVAPEQRRFQAELGISDTANGWGSVRFRVFLHETSTGWRNAFTSEIVRGGDQPLPINIDLENATAVALMVDFADRGDVLDHAVWLDARFTR